MKAGCSKKESRNHCSELLVFGPEPQEQAGRPCHYMWACGSTATTGCGAHLQMAQGPDHPPLQSYQGMHSFRWAGEQEVTSGLCLFPKPSQVSVHVESYCPDWLETVAWGHCLTGKISLHPPAFLVS